MPEFPIPSARILLVSQIQGGGNCPPCPPVRYAYGRNRTFQGGTQIWCTHTEEYLNLGGQRYTVEIYV